MSLKIPRWGALIVLVTTLAACGAHTQESVSPTRTPRPLAGPVDANLFLHDGSETSLADVEIRYPDGFRSGGSGLWVAGHMLGLRDIHTVELEPPVEITKGISEPYGRAAVTLIGGDRVEGTTLCTSMLGMISSVYAVHLRSGEDVAREIPLCDVARIELTPRQPITPPPLPDPQHDPSAAAGTWARVTNRMGETVLVHDPYLQFYLRDARYRPVKVTDIVRRDVVLEGKAATPFTRLARIAFGARDIKLKDSAQTGQTVTLTPRKGKPRTGLFDNDGKGDQVRNWCLRGEGPYGGYVMPLAYIETVEFLE